MTTTGTVLITAANKGQTEPMCEQIAPVARRELGEPPQSVSRVEEGLLQETYELGYGDAEYILQFAGADRVQELKRGLFWYRRLQHTGVPVPAVVTERPRQYDGRTYILVEKLPGTTGERDISPERTRVAGRCLATIHDAVTFDTDRRPTGIDELSTGGFDGWTRGYERRYDIEQSARVLRESGLGTIAATLDELAAAVTPGPPEKRQLCHDDFSPDNVLFRDGEVTGVIDFDRAYAGNGGRDLARAANAFWMHDPCTDWDVRATFYEGYRDQRDPGPEFEHREPQYRVETLATIVAGLLELDELSGYERGFYAERLSGAVEQMDRRGEAGT